MVALKAVLKLAQTLQQPLSHVTKGLGRVMVSVLLSFQCVSLHMNDIPNLLFDKKCLGIKLEDQNINCSMYADDLILIST